LPRHYENPYPAEYMYSKDYAFYLDVNKVGPVTVAEDLYETMYDKEQKKAFMPKKVRNETVIIPIPVS